MPTAMSEFKVLGPKEDTFTTYQTINYCEKIIAGLEQEVVEGHHPTFGKLFKWLKLAIDTRKADITLRLAMAKKARDEREKKIEEQRLRGENREQFLKDAEEQFYKDHEADMAAYEEWEVAQKAREGEDYASEEEEEDKEEKEAPVKPEFKPEDS